MPLHAKKPSYGGIISDRVALRGVFLILVLLAAGQLFGASGCDPSRLRDLNQETHHDQ